MRRKEFVYQPAATGGVKMSEKYRVQIKVSNIISTATDT
jgi:hypothetical protein